MNSREDLEARSILCLVLHLNNVTDCNGRLVSELNEQLANVCENVRYLYENIVIIASCCIGDQCVLSC